MLKRLLASSLLVGTAMAVCAAPALAQSAPTTLRADDHDRRDHPGDWRSHGRDHRPFLRRVMAATPLTQQPTCRTPGKIAAPPVRGVTYTLKSHWRPTPMFPGHWYAKTPGRYQVEATAAHGYMLQGQRTWTIDLRAPRWCHQH